MSRARRHLTRFPLLLAASACSVLFLGGCDHLHQDMATPSPEVPAALAFGFLP